MELFAPIKFDDVVTDKNIVLSEKIPFIVKS